MTERCVYVDDESMGAVFSQRFGVSVSDHVHYPTRCPVRDYLPFDAALLECGFIGAEATLRDGRMGDVLAVAPVTFEGAAQPEECLILSLRRPEGEEAAIVPVPVAKAGFHLAELHAPGPALSDHPAPKPGPRY